jgi:hypothetical protein
MKIIEELKQYWISIGIEFSKGINDTALDRLELAYGLKLPEDFRKYLLEVNGMAEYEMDGLTRFWECNRFVRLTDRFSLYDKYSSSVREYWDTTIPYDSHQHEDSECFSPLRFPAIYNETGEKLSDAKWALDFAQYYFIFGDYNIEGSHWAIKLFEPTIPKDCNIIVIYEHTNSFRYVANSFTDFLAAYLYDCSEALI